MELCNKRSVMVVGCDGLIGSSLLKFLASLGYKVLGTTRRSINLQWPRITLDLSDAKHLESWVPPSNLNTAIHCAGITKIDRCAIDPIGSFRVNVENTVRLATKLFEAGIFQVFLSTNHVFDGSKPFCMHVDATCPLNEYGRQKVEAESFFLSLGASASIVRLTKVLTPSDSLLNSWVRSLKDGYPIQPFSNMFMAPVPLSTVLNVLLLIVCSRSSGIFHVSADQDLSYAEVAQEGARAIGVSEKLVTPIHSTDAGLNWRPPENTTLNTEGILATFGVSVPHVQWTISKAFLSPKTLAGRFL